MQGQTNTLDLFLTSKPAFIFLLPLVFFLVTLITALPPYGMTSSLIWIDPLLHKKSSIIYLGLNSHFLLSIPWSLGFSKGPSSFACFNTNAINLEIISHLLTNLVKKFPRWFNFFSKAVDNKNCYFKDWKRLQIQCLRPFFLLSQFMLQNHQKFKNAFS